MVNDLLQFTGVLVFDLEPARTPPAPVESVAHDAARLPILVIADRIAATDQGPAQVRAWSATLILEALARFPGEDWQARWTTATAGPGNWVAGLGNPWGTEDRAIRHAPRGITALIDADRDDESDNCNTDADACDDNADGGPVRWLWVHGQTTLRASDRCMGRKVIKR